MRTQVVLEDTEKGFAGYSPEAEALNPVWSVPGLRAVLSQFPHVATVRGVGRVS